MIDYHGGYWEQLKSGSQGISGKKTVNAMSMFEELFSVDEEPIEEIEDSDDAMSLVLE